MPTHHQGTPQEELALNTYIKLTRATDAVLSDLYPGGKLHGLTPSQFGTLEALYHLGEMCQGEIGEKILRSSGNMTLVIVNLEKRGLITRQRDKNDRRQINVNLTNAGRAFVKKTFPTHVADILERFSLLSPQEQETLGRLLKKLGGPHTESPK